MLCSVHSAQPSVEWQPFCVDQQDPHILELWRQAELLIDEMKQCLALAGDLHVASKLRPAEAQLLLLQEGWEMDYLATIVAYLTKTLEEGLPVKSQAETLQDSELLAEKLDQWDFWHEAYLAEQRQGVEIAGKCL